VQARGCAAALVLLAACATEPVVPTPPRPPPRFERLDKVLEAARQSGCMRGLMPIPATVIDTGIFKNVPYQSFSNGTIELNGYGDPYDLVALEAGTKLDNDAVKTCVMQFIADQLLTTADRMRASRLTLASAPSTVDGLTLELTQPTAADAYGAWWFSMEQTHQVAGAAASQQELDAIVASPGAWSATAGLSPAPMTESTGYTSYRPSSPGGRVFVHGYTRKNGTYVHSYSRRR